MLSEKIFINKPMIKIIKPISIQVNEMDSKGIVAIKYPFKTPFITLKKNAELEKIVYNLKNLTSQLVS